MKHKKTIEAHVAEEVVIDCIECDFCGNRSESDGTWPRDSMTAQGRNERGVIFVHEEADDLRLYSHASYSGEGWSAREWNLDICPACFETKVVPLALPEKRSPRESYS